MTFAPRARRVLLPAAVAVLALVTACGGGGNAAPPPPSPSPTPSIANRASDADVAAHADIFGIKFLKPTEPEGTYWVSAWGAPRTFTGQDPNDPWFDADHGEATYEAGGGLLRISGKIPRMYVHDPAKQRQWRDVEVTMYFERIADTGVDYAGMTAVVRANHLVTEDQGDPCDTRGYGGRLRIDGWTDFEKETKHPLSERTSAKHIFQQGLPKKTWFGIKFLAYDQPDGVHLEYWLDKTGGANGGDWHLINQLVDNGHIFGKVPCAPGIDPEMALTNSPTREGSESGKPNVSVYFRSDGVAKDGLIYKWGSVREIAANAG